LVPYTD
jgi:hypothetical protein